MKRKKAGQDMFDVLGKKRHSGQNRSPDAMQLFENNSLRF